MDKEELKKDLSVLIELVLAFILVIPFFIACLAYFVSCLPLIRLLPPARKYQQAFRRFICDP